MIAAIKCNFHDRRQHVSDSWSIGQGAAAAKEYETIMTCYKLLQGEYPKNVGKKYTKGIVLVAVPKKSEEKKEEEESID